MTIQFPNIGPTARTAWTPTDGSGAALAFTVNAATYVKIGQVLVPSFNLTYPATVDGSAAIIGGLPFASLPTYYSGVFSIINLTSGVVCSGVIPPGATAISIYTFTSTAATITNATLSGAQIAATFLYLLP